MRVGILTFCNALNLGAALQAFALQKKLEQLGYDAELIDYRCPAIEKMHRFKPVFRTKKGIRTRVFNLLHNVVFLPRRIRYRKFQGCSKRTRAYTKDTVDQLNGVYDLFVTGSDQVFNLKLTGNDTAYFLDFVRSGKKIAYAASLGVWMEEKKELYGKYLSGFDRLSVRESSAAERFRQELGIEAEVVPDPVFLHSGEEWKKLLGIRGEKQKDRYLLIYSLIETKELYERAAVRAKQLGLKVVAVTKALKPAGKADRYVRNAGPREFIRLVANADYVVTNSFHGTAFSLVFEKQFSTLLPKAAPERILELLDDLSIRDRAASSADPEDPERAGIDYRTVGKKLELLARSGCRFIEGWAARGRS